MNQPFDPNNLWMNNTRGTGFNGYNDPYRQTPFYGTGMNYQRPSIPGHLVNNLDEITPQEVPMDGSLTNISAGTLIRNCCGDYDRVTITNTGTNAAVIAPNSAFIVKRVA